MPITIFRRHAAACPHRAKGRDFLKCACPLWADGYINGQRVLRKSLRTRDMARARQKASTLDSPDQAPQKPIADAAADFMARCQSEGLSAGTLRKYRNTLERLKESLALAGIHGVGDITMPALDRFRASRGLSPLTSSKELQLLRQFCGFCFDRRWMERNEAKAIRGPRNLKENDVQPFLAAEVAAILDACDALGRSPYERLRARAMILLLRYTALRIGDVSLLARDRISRDGDRWRVFLRTEKNGQPVFLPVPLDLKAALDAVPPPLRNVESRYFFWNEKGAPKSHKAHVDRSLRAVFKASGVPHAHAHRFRHTLATDLLGKGATFEEVADVLGNSVAIVRKHYAKWSPARQARIDRLMDETFGHTMGTRRELEDNPSYIN